MRRLIYTLYLVIPMTIYYFMLNKFPEEMASYRIFGWPLSLFFGVMVMFWGSFIAFVFARTLMKGSQNEN